jgi:hypothetical protein
MLALGIILILVSAGSLVAVLANGTGDEAVIFGNVTMPTLVVFLAGAAALLIFIMGLELVRSGIRRAHTNRKTKKKLRKLEEREDQRAEGDDTSAGPTTTAPTTTAPTATAPTAPTAPTRTDGEPSPTQPIRTSGDEPYETPPPPSR